jgi:hypothetical protein
VDLHALAGLIARSPGLLAKRDLRAIAGAIGGDGDDAALVAAAGEGVVAAAEAIAPAMVAAAPRPAGVAGVMTVVNDLAATGARPAGILDTIVAPDAALVGEILAGLSSAADLVGVPVLGGHTTVDPGAAPALATFGIGVAERPLAAAAARPGDTICLAACLEGELVEAGGVAMFSHLRGPRRARAREDLALLADAAAAGEAWAARDVSMPGLVGSLVQMAEAAGGLGARVALDAVPVPSGVPLERWLLAFPSYGFLLAGDPEALSARFGGAGLALAPVATLDASGRIELVRGEEAALVWDLGSEPLTGLGGR